MSTADRKIATSMEKRLRQRSPVELLMSEDSVSIDIHRKMTELYCSACVNISTVSRLVRTVKGNTPDTTNLHHHAYSGWPITTTASQHKAHSDELIRANRRVRQKHIAIILGISTDQVHHINHEMIVYRKLRAGYVLSMLTSEIKQRWYSSKVWWHFTQPSYSLDLAPCKFIFLKVSEHLMEPRYASGDKVQAVVRIWLREKTSDFFLNGIQQIAPCWRLNADRIFQR